MMDISDSKWFGAWLKGKPPEFACVLAARVALRVAPALRWGLREEAEERRRSVILTSFRALAVASFAGAWPERAAEIRGIARHARRETDKAVSGVVNAARMNEFEAKDAIPEMQEYIWRLEGDVRALGVAEGAVETIVHAVQGVVDAADAANGIASPEAVFESCIGATITGCQAIHGIHGGSELLEESEERDEEEPVPDYISQYWKAVERDAEFLQSVTEGGEDPEDGVVALSGRALWPGSMPVWAGRTWSDLKDELPREEGWEVWVHWYEDRLVGRSPDEASEFERVVVRSEEWERGPIHLNALLQDMNGERPESVSARIGQGVEVTPPAKLYFAPDEAERSVKPAELKRLGRRRQIDYLVHWFLGMFEDPANETPYESREGGYQYIWGGPYEAQDELDREFGGLVSEDVIDSAVSEVERDGTMHWAPGPNHPDQRARAEEAIAEEQEPPLPGLDEIRARLDGGARPQFGDPLEVGSREALRNEIGRLRELMQRTPPVHGGIGHNRPPESLTVELNVEVTQAIDRIDEEIEHAEPNVESVVESAGRLEKVVAWLGRKLEISIDAFMAKVGSTAGLAAIVAAAGWALSLVEQKVIQVFNAARGWLEAVTLLF